ncbi:MAG TPA: phosphoribosylanthranilate isomerase [Arenimonas sp.]|nr:phosphoribosylanthranilate isomerase [Arenimonas sp.]
MRTRIKFCGLTRPGDVRLAGELGVDALGFVFAAQSPRRLLPAQAAALREAVPMLASVVALFMDNPRAEVEAAIRALQPHCLQFHGSESPAFCASFGVPYIRTIAMAQPVPAIRAAIDVHSEAAAFLLDGHAPGESGGQGASFDWSAVPAIDRPCWLAGGLRPDNVGEAIRVARPFAVDVSSGIESAPGHKDGRKMQQFIEEVRRADASR